jgi:hypothetical protein
MLRRFTIQSHQCVADDATLYRHIASALARGLPVLDQYLPHQGVAVLVGSGPSVLGQLDAIRAAQQRGGFLVAIKDAHDWLIGHGIIPQAAVAIDPQESRARIFTPHPAVRYFIASQAHPALFDHLAGAQVELWHAYVRKDQNMPPHGTPMISGGTTSGLRAVTLLYSMGFRSFDLYGYDSCLQHGLLRMNGDRPRKEQATVHEIVVGDRYFSCTMNMLSQADEFQNFYWSMPDIDIRSHGDGLITAILEERHKRPLRTVSFLHHAGPTWASARYRCAIPAYELGASVNDLTADVLIVSKPEALTIPEVKQALGTGQSVIVDFCDDHFTTPHYRDLVRLADALTCSTDVLKQTIWEQFRMEATVIPDPYEFSEVAPHCYGRNLLWFGRAPNQPPTLDEAVRCVSNQEGMIPWSRETMLEEFARADIVLLPATAAYKSANRAIEAIRQGCFVVAEPHPSLTAIPGIWVGDLKEGIAWASQHQTDANARIRMSQTWISERYAPRTVAVAWSQVIQACPSTWGQVVAPGPIGSMSISTREPACEPTSNGSHSAMAAQRA